MEEGQRSFTVTRFSHVGKKQERFEEQGGKGRYISREPMNAAKKAARQIFREATNKDKSKAVYLEIRETTRGTPANLLTYKATYKRTSERKDVGGTVIDKKMKIDIVSVPSKQFKGGEGQDRYIKTDSDFHDFHINVLDFLEKCVDFVGVTQDINQSDDFRDPSASIPDAHSMREELKDEINTLKGKLNEYDETFKNVIGTYLDRVGGLVSELAFAEEGDDEARRQEIRLENIESGRIRQIKDAEKQYRDFYYAKKKDEEFNTLLQKHFPEEYKAVVEDPMIIYSNNSYPPLNATGNAQVSPGKKSNED